MKNQRQTTKVILICLFFWMTPSLLFAKEVSHPQKVELITSLQEMLGQTYDAYVIFEVEGTQKFIQFYSEIGGLFIDLPSVSLSVDEIKRADLFFRKHEIPQVTEVATDPATGEDFTLIVWRKAFDKTKTEMVVDIGLAAMIEIYSVVPNTEILVDKGWQ